MLARLTWLGTFVETQHDDFDDVAGRGPTAIVHDQQLLITEARLALDVGITRRFGLTLMAPVRIVDTSIRYLDTNGLEVQLATPGIHHRNETVSGLADPLVLASLTFVGRGWQLTARAGSTLPIGSTEENPFTLGDMGLAHQHIQLGTGTFNPVAALELSRGWGRWRAGLFALTQQALYKNRKGYQAGDRYAGGVAVRRALGKRWSLRATGDVQGETAERWDGIVHTDDGNRGRLDVIFGAGATATLSSRISLDLAVKVPVVTYAVGGQLDMPFIIELGASWSIGRVPAAKPVDPHDHGHDHEHGDHDEHGEHGDVDAAKADVADYGKPGEASELVPVPGKVTIYDFWATWCEPCKQLEPELVALARKHPDLVAVRRVDVVDWDSAAVAKHLTPKGFDLPHLKVFDAHGKLVLERSSNPGGLEALNRDVQFLVEVEAKRR